MPSNQISPQDEQVDFDALALMHLDGKLSSEQQQNFARQIAGDPEKARDLVRIAKLHATLIELGQTSEATPAPQRDQILSLPHDHRMALKPRRWRGSSLGIAVAATLLVGAAVALGVMWSPAVRSDVLQISRGSVVIERGNDRTLLSAGEMTLKPDDRIQTSNSTSARISTLHGDRLDLGSSTSLTWSNPQAPVNLHVGTLTADIMPRDAASPFQIMTPRADLLVVGTRFTVEADADLSLLTVEHGRVKLSNRNDAHHVEVGANQITATTGAGDLVATTAQFPLAVTSGLTGDYFKSSDLTGWRFRRIDSSIDFAWREKIDLGPDVNSESFSVRWRGWLVPPVSGEYKMAISADDGVRMWLDERLVFDEWNVSRSNIYSTTVTLEGGRAYPVRLDYFNDKKAGIVQWFAAIDDQSRQIVPTTWLRPLDWLPPAP